MANQIPNYSNILYRVCTVVAAVAKRGVDQVMPTDDLGGSFLRIGAALIPKLAARLEKEFKKDVPSFKLPPTALDNAQKVSDLADIISHLLQLQTT